jgi:adenosine deaminase
VPGNDAAPTAESIRRLPKAELHLHLDGSLRPATVEELARDLGLVARDAPAGAAMRRVRVTSRAGLAAALAGFELLLPLLRDRDRLARVTRELVEDLAADGVVYAELRFCPRLLAGDGFTIDEVLEVAAAAVAEAGAATGTRARLIACLMGGVEPEWNRPVLEAAVRAAGAGVVAVDLAGPVDRRPPDWVDAHARMFERAREAGLAVTVHAGEAEPPSAVRTAVERYGASRIGHATSLASDPDLLAEVVERGIILEVCPRSNYWTHTPEELPSLADHPLGRLITAGARACVNTDDRSLFANDLSTELAEVAAAQGLGSMDVAALIANGFWGAFDPDHAVEALGEASRRA